MVAVLFARPRIVILSDERSEESKDLWLLFPLFKGTILVVPS